MTCNQVQLFQINDYANHYMYIEINGCRALYSESIADRDTDRLINWLGHRYCTRGLEPEAASFDPQ